MRVGTGPALREGNWRALVTGVRLGLGLLLRASAAPLGSLNAVRLLAGGGTNTLGWRCATVTPKRKGAHPGQNGTETRGTEGDKFRSWGWKAERSFSF